MKSVKNVYLVQLESTYNTDLKIVKEWVSIWEGTSAGTVQKFINNFSIEPPIIRVVLSGLRQFVATETSLKWWKMHFILP